MRYPFPRLHRRVPARLLARPEAYLDAGVRSAISDFAKRDGGDASLAALKRDLSDGTWMRRNGPLLKETEVDAGYRLILAES
jgi:hypothetical protein